MIRLAYISFLLFLSALSGRAQILAQDTVRQQDWPTGVPMDDETIEWRQDIYRELDLTKQRNAGLYSDGFQEDETTGLFARIFEVALEGKIKLYKYDIDGNERLIKRNQTDIKHILDDFHIAYTCNGDTVSVNKSDIPFADVTVFYLKEAIYYDVINSSGSGTGLLSVDPLSKEELMRIIAPEADLMTIVFDANGNALPIVHSKLGPQGTKFTCQAVDYCKTIIQNPDQPEKLKDLVKAILNYGQCAQIQFGYDLDHLANPEGYLAEEMKTVEADPANDPVIPSNAADVGWEYGTLTLKGAVSANLYFSKQITAKDASGKTYTVKAKSGKWCITFDNIPAKNLGDKYTVVASYGGKTATIQYSALSYINAVLGNPNQPENLKELCKAMILYNKYAKAYFGK